ncbi:MAG: glycerate kinase [Cyclobacteriaceae bacterium]
MNILIAPDKFKGSLNAREICESISHGILEINPEAIVDKVPLADGGEGTCDLLTEWHAGKKIDLTVQGPLFTPVSAHYGISKDGDVAFIEMAVASGLTLLGVSERDPLLTTTLGTGEMIVDALNRGVKKIILGIGGSASNDAGIGMATALGFICQDFEGTPLKPTGENLIHLHKIQFKNIHPRLRNVQVVALCDVSNPLFGPDGAAYVYGPQKGADMKAVQLLDAGLRNFRRVIHKNLGSSVDFAGAGAAGGLGAGAKVFLGATMEKGISHMIRTTHLEERIKKADFVITGEGKIDRQTFSGKVVSEVARLAHEAGKGVIAICGKCDLSEEEMSAQGFKKVISLVDNHTTSETAIQHASAIITRKIADECKYLLGG